MNWKVVYKLDGERREMVVSGATDKAGAELHVKTLEGAVKIVSTERVK